MRVFVRAKPNTRENSLEEIDPTHFVVRVAVPAEGGKANRAVARLIARRFGIAPSRVRMISGGSSRRKIFEIL